VGRGLAETAASASTPRRRAGGRDRGVGTTSLRLLESAATGGEIAGAVDGRHRIFITPGYRFKCRSTC
jgi:S-adenosylmethionine:tRNA ribosyltransferase-isomerase